MYSKTFTFKGSWEFFLERVNEHWYLNTFNFQVERSGVVWFEDMTSFCELAVTWFSFYLIWGGILF